MPSSARPKAPDSTTVSRFNMRTWSRVSSGGKGEHSRTRAWIVATGNGSGMSARRRHVADIDRLEARGTPADQRQRRHEARQRGKAVEESILGPEDQGRPQHRRMRKFRPHRRFAGRLAAPVGRWRCRIGAERREMNEAPHAGRPGKRRKLGRRFFVNGAESLRAALIEDAGGVDHRIGALKKDFQPAGIGDGAIYRCDLADICLLYTY